MEINIDLTDAQVTLDSNDITDAWNIIADDVENLMYRTTEYMIPMLENNFDYYFPYVEEFYNKIKELEEKNNG